MGEQYLTNDIIAQTQATISLGYNLVYFVTGYDA